MRPSLLFFVPRLCCCSFLFRFHFIFIPPFGFFADPYSPGSCILLKLDCAFSVATFYQSLRATSLSSSAAVETKDCPYNVCCAPYRAVLDWMWWFFVFRQQPSASGCHFDDNQADSTETRDRKLSCRGNLIFCCWARNSLKLRGTYNVFDAFHRALSVARAQNLKRIDAALEVQLKKKKVKW